MAPLPMGTEARTQQQNSVRQLIAVKRSPSGLLEAGHNSRRLQYSATQIGIIAAADKYAALVRTQASLRPISRDGDMHARLAEGRCAVERARRLSIARLVFPG